MPPSSGGASRCACGPYGVRLSYRFREVLHVRFSPESHRDRTRRVLSPADGRSARSLRSNHPLSRRGRPRQTHDPGLVSAVCARPRPSPRARRLRAVLESALSKTEELLRGRLDPDVATHLIQLYGEEALRVARYGDEAVDALERIDPPRSGHLGPGRLRLRRGVGADRGRCSLQADDAGGARPRVRTRQRGGAPPAWGSLDRRYAVDEWAGSRFTSLWRRRATGKILSSPPG